MPIIIYVVHNEEFFGGDDIKIFKNKENASSYLNSRINDTNQRLDYIISDFVICEPSENKVYLVLDESWYGHPKAFINKIDAQKYVDSINKMTVIAEYSIN